MRVPMVNFAGARVQEPVHVLPCKRVGELVGEPVARIVDKDSDERGSAAVEFVLIALPLFLPTLVLFLALNKSAAIQSDQEFLARQVLSAFISGSDDGQAYRRADALVERFAKSAKHFEGLSYRIICQSSPCLSPGSAVEVQILLRHEFEGIPQERNVEYLAQARGFVDKWRA